MQTIILLRAAWGWPGPFCSLSLPDDEAGLSLNLVVLPPRCEIKRSLLVSLDAVFLERLRLRSVCVCVLRRDVLPLLEAPQEVAM